MIVTVVDSTPQNISESVTFLRITDIGKYRITTFRLATLSMTCFESYKTNPQFGGAYMSYYDRKISDDDLLQKHIEHCEEMKKLEERGE